MKKLTLLLTLLCASALNGMGPGYGHFRGLGDLPPEIQVMIIQTLNTYNTLDDVINAIKAISKTNQQLNAIVTEEYGNQKRFNALVHTLANKFNTTTKTVAQKLGTLAAKIYITAGDILVQAIKNNSINHIIQAINAGADINYSFNTGHETLTPLLLAVTHEQADIVKLLLEKGANPNFIGSHDVITERGLKAIDYLSMKKDNSEQKEKIKALLEEAMKKK